MNFMINNPAAADSPTSCLSQCRHLQYKYSGIHDGKQCLCTSLLGAQSINDTCPLTCISDNSKLCGGPSSMSVYETGFIVSGPPKSLSQLSKHENTMKITWEHPVISNGIILEYHVAATPVSSYSVSTVGLPMDWVFLNVTTITELPGLQPGTQYNITVKAKTMDGYGVPLSNIFNTEIGAPDKPERPVVIKSANNTATIQLKPILPSHGPITSYRIIVLNEDAASIGVHKDSPLKNWAEANAENIPFYIAAELSPEFFKQEFVVGDGGTFNNPPLPDDREVLFVLGVVSTYEGVSKYSFSEPSNPIGVDAPEVGPKFVEAVAETQPPSQQTPLVVVEEDPGTNGNSFTKLLEETDLIDKIPIRKTKPITSGRSTTRRQRLPYGRDPPALVVGLSAAIGVLGFLLLISIFVYFYLRHKVHRNDLNRRKCSRKQSDRQGLTHGGSTSTIELDSGYVHSSFVMGIEETAVDHYESLIQRMWTIPSENIVKTADSIGSGKFGKVLKGNIQRGESKIEAALHIIEDKSLAKGERNSMLKDLGVLIKVGQHANIAGIIGVCEEPEMMLVATEFYGMNLKEFLLNSRALNNYPSYATKEQRFSTLHEAQAIDVGLGITKGMAYLQSLSVPHKRLSSRTIFICSTDGTVPKISGFGMDYYQPNNGQSTDFKRWIAPEALTSPQHAPKCEVWSFGIILWEIVTLGATPYVDIRVSKELIQRVQRGLRLKQPGNIGLPLYQIMVSCWQIDLDERPAFQELVEVLQQAFNQALDYLSFNLYPEFTYERYDPTVEVNR
ncbi:hypothetical protein DAPPUDRAFT_309238 [Daphnia pulex]|uniref:Receptor protein-tyrosine kinase n=1 Tax=Daphnia pulex TaxID=6669 RepID=E9HB47_DAPPU|nr:hypothetical protein DAPPUDRAFT_309238 [Daphnia pulex]|eukprot:EFX71032.1 hypothetical protein DAPPUDRAFT_309238 [Daphnia pulex]